MSLKHLLPLAAFLLLVGLLAVGLTLNPREVPSPFIDKPAPAFSLPQLHDPEKNFSVADMQGKVWLLNVWASWCVSCRAEHELISALAKQNLAAIVGLNYKDSPMDAQRWLKRYGDPYLLSVSDIKGDVGIDWGVYGVPETFVIDKKGIVRFKNIGPVTEESLQQTIIPLIGQLQGEGA
ncbi:MAG: DsbE family thiol:disulfide interchange protein [Gammaproteobacteria bacterium]|nr:DsbE family thiol:disulfide interchange protein [Gammaproteobacteria bacterium]